MTARKTNFAIDRVNDVGLLAAYFPVNDPLIPLGILDAYEAAQVDVVELGIKTQNPYADGQIVATSMRRSTGQGTVAEAKGAIEAVRAFENDALGMIFAYAKEQLAPEPEIWNDVDGLLCLGAPSAHNDVLNQEAESRGVRITRYVPYGLPSIAVDAARQTSGFVFLQYTQGKTGLRSDLDDLLSARVKTLRKAGITVPILAGIGISSIEQVTHAMQNGVDGIVVGSRAVQKAIEGKAALEDYLCAIREALNGR